MKRPYIWIGGTVVVLVAAFYALNAFIYSEKQGAAGDGGSVVGSWTWLRTERADGEVLTAPVGKFVLTFDDDGLMYSSTDCNSLTGSYVGGERSLSFGPMATTLMFCEGTLEAEYARQLSLTESYAVASDSLRLVMAAGEGEMVFGRTVAAIPGGTDALSSDPKNATYLIDGQRVTLTDGGAVLASDGVKQAVRYFGNSVFGDLNGDGRDDIAFLLTVERGGSGTYYYVAAALKMENGYLGTNAVLLGDRIAPQTTEFSEGQLLVNFADRNPGDPFTAQPSVGVSRRYAVTDGVLAEVSRP